MIRVILENIGGGFFTINGVQYVKSEVMFFQCWPDADRINIQQYHAELLFGLVHYSEVKLADGTLFGSTEEILEWADTNAFGGGGGGSKVFDSSGDFPMPGKDGIIYINKSDDSQWYWDGAEYVQLTSFMPYDTLAAFPNPGNKGFLYLDKSTGTTYYWDGAAYHPISNPAAFIQNQILAAQAASFWLNGTAIIGSGTNDGGKLQVKGGVVSLAQSTADYPIINGAVFYRSDTMKIRAGVNGQYQNLALESGASVGSAVIIDPGNPNATDIRTGIARTSTIQPFRTIQAGLSAAQYNDTVIIRPAVYNESVIYSSNNAGNNIVIISAIINGSFMQSGDMGAAFIWLRLLNGAVINGQVGQPFNLGGNLRIGGDKTGKIVTGNQILFSNTIEVSGLDVCDCGTAFIGGYQTIKIYNCNSITGHYNGAMFLSDIGSFSWTDSTRAGSYMQMKNIGKMTDLYVPTSGTEHNFVAEGVNFEYNNAPNMSALYNGSFKNCTFIGPSGLTGFSNNPNYYYLWENCGFQFTGVTAQAITIVLNAGSYATIRNCSTNAGAMVNAGAQILESNSYANANYKILRGF